ncbi:MAG: hypothetical protein MZW92_31750 [Comamonadaceae bacterium]|nr:hypothetical protein [Comamonadaceae bacterium]
MTLTEFADLLGVRPSYVTKLKQRGRLVFAPGGKKVDVEASRARIKATEPGAPQNRAAKRHWEEQRNKAPDAPEAPAAPPPDGDDPAHAGSRAYWEQRDAAARAKMREIELAKMKGDLVAWEDVKFTLDDFGAVWRGLLENPPTAPLRRCSRSPRWKKPTP